MPDAAPTTPVSAPPRPSRDASLWRHDPSVTYLNHGSFGGCPTPILARQSELRDRMEAEPIRFMVDELEPLLVESIGRLAAFIGAPPDGVVPVTNATTGVNAVLRSLDLSPGDELLVTDHEYNACRNAVEFVAQRAGARVVVAAVPFPIASPDQVVRAILSAVTPRTRLALIDHITSQTALIFPIVEVVRELKARGVETLVDGAHAPGMVPVDIGRIDPAYYTGNCHKWMCCPKGAGFLYVREGLRDRVRPVVISHGANSARTDRSRYFIEFTWTGTGDPTPFCCIPAALDFMASLAGDGWEGVMRENRGLALWGRDAVCAALGVARPAPDSMIGSMASIPLPDKAGPKRRTNHHDDLQERLIARGFQVPIVPWPRLPQRLVRISAQRYNSIGQYSALGDALVASIDGERRESRR